MQNVELYFWDGEQEGRVPPADPDPLPEFYRTRYRTAKVDRVRLQALGSAALLKEHLGVTSDDQLVRDEHGRIALREDPRHCCLSHSGVVTVLAVSDGPVGVDLERIQTVSEPTVSRVYPASFQKEMEGLEGEARDEMFTRLWTKLEAALKLDGRGLTAPRTEYEDILARCEITSKQVGDRFVSIAVPKE